MAKRTRPWWETFFGPDYLKQYEIDAERTAAEVGAIETILHLRKGARVLDLACGAGRHSIELAKRYTTTTMGPCQGKLCHLPSIRVYAQETRMYESAIGSTTARPPRARLVCASAGSDASKSPRHGQRSGRAEILAVRDAAVPRGETQPGAVGHGHVGARIQR